ncbi:dTMP kinase [Spirosoma foliorum]|uniref:Thymidylate kinase n=1 Tax=Spirosoma foliorum TaxID=2710596 RepID=A0A7G5GRH3_9BACT|nr:dTMP kinase [Spirosoma foliorum]QMW01465.1 dTMP kinase [Spirosoma foliorum]
MNTLYPFIAIEGIDGAGKTSVRNILIKLFENINITPFIVGQHSWLNVDISRQIINIRENRYGCTPEDILLSYALDKNLHSTYNIKNACRQTVVIADRYIYSDAVYHQVLYQIPVSTTMSLHKTLCTIEPDIILFIEVDPSIAYSRLLKRSQRIQHYGRLAKLEPIQEVYNNYFKSHIDSKNSTFINFINENENIFDRVSTEIWPHILKKIKALNNKF